MTDGPIHPGLEGANFTLVFSYFNGVYEQDGTHRGRPVYKERRKYNNGPFHPSWWVVPAEIRYSNTGNFWVFTHPWIQKLVSAEDDVSVSFLGFVSTWPFECFIRDLVFVIMFHQKFPY